MEIWGNKTWRESNLWASLPLFASGTLAEFHWKTNSIFWLASLSGDHLLDWTSRCSGTNSPINGYKCHLQRECEACPPSSSLKSPPPDRKGGGRTVVPFLQRMHPQISTCWNQGPSSAPWWYCTGSKDLPSSSGASPKHCKRTHDLQWHAKWWPSSHALSRACQHIHAAHPPFSGGSHRDHVLGGGLFARPGRTKWSIPTTLPMFLGMSNF